MKSIALSIIIGVMIIGGAIVFSSKSGPSSAVNTQDANNVSIVDGKQIVEVSAKGGYVPKKSVAKAGIPTILRFHTNGTYDCSASVRIPSMGISKFFPPSGATDIDVGTPKVAMLQGTCGMGMYSFQIDFRS